MITAMGGVLIFGIADALWRSSILHQELIPVLINTIKKNK
jgi:hypothetical protein